MEAKKDTVMKGYILRETVLGKDLKSVSYYDYFFMPSDSGSSRMFIKVNEGDVSAEQVNALLKKESDRLWKSNEVDVVAVIKKGRWDEPDFRSNVNLTQVPGREGRYLVLKEINQNNQASKEYTGRIIKSQQVNKAGRKLKTYDYFFETGGKEYFVKSGKNTLSRDSLEVLVKKENSGDYKSGTIKILGEIKEGLWDTDDPRQQSRIGKYILIYNVIEK